MGFVLSCFDLALKQRTEAEDLVISLDKEIASCPWWSWWRFVILYNKQTRAIEELRKRQRAYNDLFR